MEVENSPLEDHVPVQTGWLFHVTRSRRCARAFSVARSPAACGRSAVDAPHLEDTMSRMKQLEDTPQAGVAELDDVTCALGGLSKEGNTGAWLMTIQIAPHWADVQWALVVPPCLDDLHRFLILFQLIDCFG